MAAIRLLTILALVAGCYGQDISQQICNMDRQMVEIGTNANVYLGGLFSMRGQGQDGFGCGRPLTGMMQIYEAARFTLNQVNNNNYLNGVTMGMRVYDTCLSATQATNALLKLYPQSTSSNPFCSTTNQVMAGVVGPTISGLAVAVADLANRIPVNVISPSAMSSELSNNVKYPYFFRTVPSNAVLAKTIIEVLKKLQWENFVVVFAEDAFGRSLYEQLLQAAYSNGLCVSRSVALDGSGDKDTYKTAMAGLGSNSFQAAVLLAGNVDAQVALQAAQETSTFANTQWILGDLDMTKDLSSMTQLHGAMLVVPRSPLLTEFQTYFTGLENNPTGNSNNPWFEDWFEETYACSFAGGARPCSSVNRGTFMQSPWVVPTMKAILAYMEVIRQVCPGSGACQQLRSMTPNAFRDRLRDLDFTVPNSFPVTAMRGQRIKFDANGDPEMSDFTVYNYNNQGGAYMFREVGRFVSGVLTLDGQAVVYDASRNTVLTPIPTARCSDMGCMDCLLPQRSVNFRYTPGDLVIASLVNAHAPGRTSFTCGEGMASRLASLVAAEWAIGQYKTQNPNKLRQVSLGSLVADVCPDSVVAQSFLVDLLSGNNRLMAPSGASISSSNIKAFVDMTESMEAKIISPILSQYMIPELETSATTPMLMNGGMTPYFSRAVPNDEVFYTAIASMLLKAGWKYVQVATHSTGRYQEMTETFIKVAANHGICVVGMSNHFDSKASNRYDMAMNRLLNNNNSQVVVVIGGMEDVRGMLEVIQRTGTVGRLQLIAGTDRWAMNPDFIRGYEAAASGSIVVGLEMAADTAFRTYLTSMARDLSAISSHPFLRELFEITNQCSVGPSTRGAYNRTCTATESFNVYQGKTPYIIQGIYTVADKLHEVINDLCPNYNGLCTDFRAATDIGRRLDEKLQNTAKSGGFGIKNGEGITDIVFYRYNQGSNNYAEAGRFNTENQRLGSLTITNSNYISMCGGVCMECQYTFALQNSLFANGDWIIAGVFGVSNPGPKMLQPFVCGDIRLTNGPQYTMAMLYALNQVNMGRAPVSVKGVTFGGLALDHCMNEGRANLIVSDYYSGLNPMGVDQNQILAWMTDDTASTNEVAEILNPLGVAIVSPSATSASLMDYEYFYRTVQGTSATASALAKVVKSLGFSYIQVVYSDNMYGDGGFKSMDAAAMAEGICISKNTKFDNVSNVDAVISNIANSETQIVVLFTGEADTEALMQAINNNAMARTSLLVLMPEPFPAIVKRYGGQLRNPVISLRLQKFDLTGYHAYINSDSSPLANPFFARYYMAVKQCNLPGYSMYANNCPANLEDITTAASYMEDNFILSTIDAVYAIVDALDRTVKEFCPNNYTTPCAAFVGAPDKRARFNRNLMSVSFVDDAQQNFRFRAREGDVSYDIRQSNSNGDYTTVGSYKGVSLDLNDAVSAFYKNVTSGCTAPCLDCIMRGLTFSLTPGDIYLAGMFDVHQRSVSPFLCGKIQTVHGFLLLEAFRYALDKVNDKRGQFANILNGVTLGGVGLDACSSAVRGSYLISNIHNGLTTLNKDGRLVMPSNIDTYIGSYESTASIYMARVLTDLGIPQISYASGSEVLSDQRVFPYFYRTVPADNKEVEAILKFLDKMDIRYVQIIFESGNWQTAQEAFLEMASQYSICVAQSVEYNDIGVISPEVSNDAVSRLLEKPAANTVVTFLGTLYVNSLLKAVQLSDRARNKFRFVGSSDWADYQDALYGAESQAVGSVTLKLDADDVQEFETYISDRSTPDENPWYSEYFQEINNCYLSKANTNGYPEICRPRADITQSDGYQQDPSVVYVINAVYAAAYGIHETLQKFCGTNYQAVCQAYRTGMKHRMNISENLANVKFTDPVGNPFMFVNHSGVASYRFNNIVQGVLGGTNYRQIGSFNVTSGMVSVNDDYTSRWDSACDREDACAECPDIRDPDLRYVFHKSVTQDPTTTLVAFFDIHKQGVDPYRCGDLNMEGYQQFLAFFYSIEQLLKSDVTSKQIRVLALDTCSNSLRVDQDLFGLLEGNGLCNTNFAKATISAKNIGGVITLGDSNTMAAARVLERPSITYISPNAMSTMLDDKYNLARTIAPTSAMMKFLVELLEKLGWSYVDVIYEDSKDGLYPWQRFEYYANLARVCRGSSLRYGTDQNLDSLLAQLNNKKGSRAVILLGSEEFVRQVMERAYFTGILSNYIWVLGMDWDLTEQKLNQLVPFSAAVNIITVQRITDMVNNFDTFMETMTYSKVHDPNSLVSVPQEWYDEFYQMVMDCTLPTAFKQINNDKPICDTTKDIPSLAENMRPQQNKYVINTIAATYAMTKGIKEFLDDCGTQSNCQNLDTLYNRMRIRDKTLDINWLLLSTEGGRDTLDLKNNRNLRLQFTNDTRWWDTGYELTHFMKSSNGQWTNTMLSNGTIGTIKPEKIRADVNQTSACLQSQSQGGCGCTYGAAGEALKVTGSSFDPLDHRNYFKYADAMDTSPELDWPIWAIVVCALTALGLIFELIVFLILLCSYPIRSGTTVLGYMVNVGIIAIYAINFAFFLPASDATCGARRFLMGVFYMIALAPLLIKAIDNWRFSQVDYVDPKRYSGISSSWVLFFIAIGIVLIQCIIPIMWLILVHPTASYWPVVTERHDNWWCDPVEDYDIGLVLSFIFVMFILLVTAAFSALTYDTDRNNYESRWILFGCIATAGCFLVWMIVTTNAGPPFRDPAVAIANFVNASMLMLILPFRKLVLMFLYKRGDYKEEGSEMVNGGPAQDDLYSNSYNNPALELNDYDNGIYLSEKPSDF